MRKLNQQIHPKVKAAAAALTVVVVLEGILKSVGVEVPAFVPEFVNPVATLVAAWSRAS